MSSKSVSRINVIEVYQKRFPIFILHWKHVRQNASKPHGFQMLFYSFNIISSNIDITFSRQEHARSYLVILSCIDNKDGTLIFTYCSSVNSTQDSLLRSINTAFGRKYPEAD